MALAWCGCRHVENEWVTLDDFSDLDPMTAFIPYSVANDEAQATAELAETLDRLENDGISEESASSGPLRTSSFNVVGLAKELFSNWHAGESRSYCGTYMSVDEKGMPIRLSGRIVVPLNKKVHRIMVVSHYTIGANHEAPSMSFPLEGIFASRGIAVIVPDYIGYGITADRVHPYLCSNLTAKNVVDMYLAALPFMKHIGCMPEHEEIILFGYSQGGATTMAVSQNLEYSHSDVKVRLVMAGGGPYDICVTYDKLIDNNFTDYPCAIPLIIQGMNIGHELNLDYSQFFLPRTLENMDEWINSKRYTMAKITKLMGTKKLTDIMTEQACNKTSDGMTDLYLAMLGNSMTTYSPQVPVYLFHSMDDNVVPYENAAQMLATVQHGGCNVETNFGHYGGHVQGYLRFLYTAINLLYEHGEIEKKF